jgi:hypothetical protein
VPLSAEERAEFEAAWGRKIERAGWRFEMRDGKLVQVWRVRFVRGGGKV